MKEKFSIFSYGSLVNPDTLDFSAKAYPARVKGYCRSWGHCVSLHGFNLRALTVVKRKFCEIEGVVLVADESIAQILNKREIGYKPVRVTPVLKDENYQHYAENSYLYIGKKEFQDLHNVNYSIPQSYLDCVLDGYLKLGGTKSAFQFIESTDGWDVPIMNDRNSPKYPRALELTDNRIQEIDRILVDSGIATDGKYASKTAQFLQPENY